MRILFSHNTFARILWGDGHDNNRPFRSSSALPVNTFDVFWRQRTGTYIDIADPFENEIIVAERPEPDLCIDEL